MTPSYDSIPKKSSILRSLNQPSTIPFIEEILHQKSGELQNLLVNKEDINLGTILRLDRHPNEYFERVLFPPVQRVVDRILVTTGQVEVRMVRGFQSVDTITVVQNSIEVYQRRGIPASMIIGHEYVHLLQANYFEWWPDFSEWDPVGPAFEGHARGVERLVCQEFFKKTQNPAYLWKILNEDVAEMRAVYQWVCNKSGKRQRTELCGVPSMYDEENHDVYQRRGEPCCHALGNVWWQKQESKYGSIVYQKFLAKK